MDRPLTAKEAAGELGYNIHHLYKLLRNGIVKGERFNQSWMIDRRKVERIKALQGSGGRLTRSVPEHSDIQLLQGSWAREYTAIDAG